MFRNNRYIRNHLDVEIPAHLNFGKFLLDRIKEQAKDKSALINGLEGTEITYGELAQYAVDLAVSLTKLGICRGDVVAICSQYRDDYLPTILGTILTGATYTPFRLGLGRAHLKHYIDLSKPKYLIFSKKFWDVYGIVLQNVKFEKYIVLDEMDFDTAISIKDLISKNYNVDEFVPANVNGQEDLVHIMYTSGSTDVPKGIMITHLCCISNSLIHGFNDSAIKTAILRGNWSLTYDKTMAFKLLAAGKTLVYYNGDASSFLKCIDKYQANIAFIRPAMAYDIADLKDFREYNLNHLQYIYCGTSALTDDIRNKLQTRLPNLTIIAAYGMTETSELVSQCWGDPTLKPKALGKPGLRVTLKVVNLSTGQPLGPNQKGEICVDAHNKFKGYIGLDPATYLDEEGFLKTGDLGYYDEDGYIYFVDRIKEMISNSGFMMSPLEIEAILHKHPGVKDVGVIGKPDPKFGEYPIPFIVKEPGIGITEKELLDYFYIEAPDQVQLRGGVIFVDAIPRNYMGKIMRPDLKKMLDLLKN